MPTREPAAETPAAVTPAAAIAAVNDPALRATIVARVPLRYAAGADPALDRPAHVRAGSGVAWVGERLAVVQDDANFVALVDPRTGEVAAVTLPAGPGGARQFDEGRGNKRDKLDLEACVVHRGVLYAFGSGSTSARERVLRVAGLDSAAPEIALLDGAAFYAALRAAPAFCGSELNVEGAALLEDGAVLRLFQRGNGAPREGRAPLDATCDVPLAPLLAHLADGRTTPVPALARIASYALGAVDGARLTFTDAAAAPGRAGAVFYLAAAEDSPDTYHDGPVAGCALGVIAAPSGPPGSPRVRYALITDAARGGALARDKPEGLALDPRDPARAFLVIDRDDPGAPSELCTVTLAGPW